MKSFEQPFMQIQSPWQHGSDYKEAGHNHNLGLFGILQVSRFK